MKIIIKFLLLTLLTFALNNNCYSTEKYETNNNKYNYIEQQNTNSISLSTVNEQVNDNQQFDYDCILADEEYKELNNTLRSISMPFQFIDDYSMVTHILDWILKKYNVTKQQIEHYSRFLYTIRNHTTKLNDLLINPNNTNEKCHKPLSNVVTSLIKSFVLFYNNMLNHLWIIVILSDRNFDKYTKNIKINKNLIERISNKSIDEILKYYEKQYSEYYNYFKYIL